MENILLVIATVLTIVIVARCILKNYNSMFIFFATGILVFLGISIFTQTSVLGDSSTGNIFIDVFELVSGQFKSSVGGIGATLMAVTGYAMYMTHLKASNLLAGLATKPLAKLNKPYIVLGFIFVVGIFLKMTIPSHSGLSLLLMATAFPIVVNLGVSTKSAAAVMIACGALDWGPNDGSAVYAAEEIVGIPIMEFFTKYQVPMAIILILTLAVTLSIYSKHMDKKEGLYMINSDRKEVKDEKFDIPKIYAILPLLPLALVTAFSFTDSIKMDVIAANMIGFTVAFACEVIRTRDLKAVSQSFMVPLEAMGNCLAKIVSIIVAAGVFAEAVKALGGVQIIANFLAGIQGMTLFTIAAMSLITFGAVILLGSGNASWYAFAPLVPDIASRMGLEIASIAVPMHFATAIGRSLSPVAGVVIAVAGMAGLEATDLIKRNIVPMVIAFIVNVLASYILFVI